MSARDACSWEAESSMQEMLQQIEDDITTILLAQQTGAEDAPPVVDPSTEQVIEPNEPSTHTDIQNPLGFLASAAIDQDKETQSAPGPSKYWSGEWVSYNSRLMSRHL